MSVPLYVACGRFRTGPLPVLVGSRGMPTEWAIVGGQADTRLCLKAKFHNVRG